MIWTEFMFWDGGRTETSGAHGIIVCRPHTTEINSV